MTRIKAMLFLLLSGVAAAAYATPHPFYVQMLQRGISSAQQGRDSDAERELKVAAFGLLGDLPSYQKAQMYLAVVNERLEDRDEARIAAVKFLQAERISAAYATIDVAPEVRSAFEQIAASAADPEYLASIPSFRRSAPREVAMVASNSTESALAKAQPTHASDVQEESTATAPEPPVRQDPKPAVQRSDKPLFTERISAAQKMLEAGQRSGARQAFLALAAERSLSRVEIMTVAEGLNRLGEWRDSAEVYARALPWVDGDEHHMFLEAVNRYEMGERKRARELLDRALPKLPPSRELAIYRGMIEAETHLP